MMAMGTSALESGLLGIPTILLDASFFLLQDVIDLGGYFNQMGLIWQIL